MTFREWMIARRLLFEEHIGTYLRASDNRRSSEYVRSVALLKKHGVPQES